MRMRHGACLAATLALLFLGACGSDPVAPVDGGGGGTGGGPLLVFDVFLRPNVIERGSSLAGGLPNPQLSPYNLTSFYSGGQPGPTFTWTFDPRLGTLLPKTLELTANSATVALMNDGRTPLGIYDMAVEAVSGNERSSITRRVAVGELNWMKHQRAIITNPADPPADLVQSPVFVPATSGPDRIIFVASPSKQAVNLWSIAADQRLDQSSQSPETSLFKIPYCSTSPCAVGTVDPMQVSTAEEREPDVAPAGLGRNEILFSSQMDTQFHARQQARNRDKFPYNLWVSKLPEGIIQFDAKGLTFDATFDSLGGTYYRVWAHRQPRWDPSANSPRQVARIAFISNRGPDPNVASGSNLWLGDLMDYDLNGTSDELVNLRAITTVGGVLAFDWAVDGQSIYLVLSGKDLIHRLDVNSLAIETISLEHHDPALKGVLFPSISRTDPNLMLFQATSEARVYLYVYDLAADTLLRVAPYAFATGRNLFPRWHTSRRDIAFVCDYSVARWTSNDPAPVPPDFVGKRRTQYPSVWTIRLQER